VQVQNALLYIADNLNNIPALKVIFDELKSKGLSEVVLVADDIGPLDPTGAYAVNPDGSRVTFAQQEGEGETVRANTVWFTNSDGTDSVTITFNTNAAWASNGLDWAVVSRAA